MLEFPLLSHQCKPHGICDLVGLSIREHLVVLLTAPCKLGPPVIRLNAWEQLGRDAWLRRKGVGQLLKELILQPAHLEAELLSGSIFFTTQWKGEIKSREIVAGVLLRISKY